METYMRFCPYLERNAIIVEKKKFRIKFVEKNEI